MSSTSQIVEPSLFGVLVQFNSVYCGILLTSIQLPEQCAVLGVLRNKEVILVEENPQIHAGDYILAMAIHPMMAPMLEVLLEKTHPVYYSLKECPLEKDSVSQQEF